MIEKAIESTVHYVTLSDDDSQEWKEYIRHGPESWSVLMGMSWEEHYDCDNLEQEFQEFINNS